MNYLKNFNNQVLSRVEKGIEDYGLFSNPISPSADISERDFNLILFTAFKDLGYAPQVEYKIANTGERIDFYLKKPESVPHFLEVKDCGIYEVKYEKSLAYSEEIERGQWDGHSYSQLTFGQQSRTESKTNWLHYYNTNALTESIAKDAFKFYNLIQGGEIAKGSCCSCMAFTFWPQPFPHKYKHFANINKGDIAIEAGTRIMVKQMRKSLDIVNLEYDVLTIGLPAIDILNPRTAKYLSFVSGSMKLTIELLSWNI